MRTYSSATYYSRALRALLGGDERSLAEMSSSNVEVEVVENLFRETWESDSQGPSHNLFGFGASVLAFKGTESLGEFLRSLLAAVILICITTFLTRLEEAQADAAIQFHRNKNEKCGPACTKVCYRHEPTGEKCSKRCNRGCDTHAKYLDGGVHQGFYNLLFKSCPADKSHRYLTEGPVNVIAVILEKVLYEALEHDSGRWQTGLWITGHSLGGALASLVMARLQTIVREDDPLVRGLNKDAQERFTGSTVLSVMASQVINNFPAAHACESCVEPECESNDWKNCSKCAYCRMMRSKVRRRMDWVDKRRHCCIKLWDNKFKAACTGCKNFMDNEVNTTTCEKENEEKKCFCGECGNCDDCKRLESCRWCKMGSKNWPVVLRGCYTFGSPKVGDEEFAKTFDENQKLFVKRIENDRIEADKLDEDRKEADNENYRGEEYNGWDQEKIQADRREDIKLRFQAYWPVYWRIVNEKDEDYRHVGYRVQLPSDPKQPPIIAYPKVRSSTSESTHHSDFDKQERDRIKGST
ncbi:hypothetical protein BGZ80_004303, partial [Entomortierella chlamydospora]